MVNKLLWVLIVMIFISCFNRREYNHLEVNFIPSDSSISINDSSFYIRKVVIENDFGKKLYESNPFINNKFMFFSDKDKLAKNLILDSIRLDTMDKYIYIQVAKKGQDDILINFNSVPFKKFTDKITLQREKTPFP